MPQTIDVTGLPPQVVRAVESLVDLLREKPAPANGTPTSIFDVIGKAPHPLTDDQIAQQLLDERSAWGES